MNKNRLISAVAALTLALPITGMAASINYDFNFSTAGTGSFIYDDVSQDISQMEFNFGAYGSNSGISFGSSLTASIFGAPPNSHVSSDNTFFSLNSGTAPGLRLNSDGSFCVRPDGGACGGTGTGTGADLAVGTYNISSVPVPAALWLFGSALGALGFLGKRKAHT